MRFRLTVPTVLPVFLPVLVLLTALLSGCGDVPRPFDHTGSAIGSGYAPQLVTLATANTVTVVPPDGIPDADARLIARDLAEALVTLETPAQVGQPGEAPGYILRADYQPLPVPTLLWDLTEPRGHSIATHRQVLADEPASRLAQTLAPLIEADRDRPLQARMALNAAPAPRQTDRRVPVRVEVTPSPGANAPPKPSPESLQQARLLKQAMESALRQDRLTLTDDTTAPAIVVRGVLSVGREPARTPDSPVPVAVTWTVVDPAGTAIGTARQENPVPGRLVRASFPMLAVAIAQAGAGGVADVIAQIPGVARQ